VPDALTGKRLWDGGFWGVALVLAAVLPFIFTSDYFGTVAVQFAIYASINLMWMLVIGTAGIYSFATVALVGTPAYVAAYAGGASLPGMLNPPTPRALPVVVELLIGLAAGAVLGAVISAPAIRLRGVYFALFTIGLAEVGRSIVSSVNYANTLGGNQGLYGATTFKKTTELGTDTGRYIDYFVVLGLLVFCLIVYRLVDGGRLGLLLRAARESEQVAGALGVSIVRARFAVFIISSAVLGLIGGFYVGVYSAISPDIYSFDTLLLLLAMIVVGGLGSAKGVILGTALLLFIREHWSESGAPRFIAIGIIMLAVTLGTTRGLVGFPAQLRSYWQRYRGREPEEAAATSAPSELEAPGGL
jgi:branched-chain amino acid transport system permease protein